MSLAAQNIGSMDRRFLFQKQVIVTNAVGNSQTPSWVDAFTVYGKFLAEDGTEKFEANQQVGVRNARIMIRFSFTSVPVETMRVTDLTLNEVYYVNGVSRDSRLGICTITAQQRDNQ